ncbi:MAG: leucine-rich repeat domain-containing protein [Bacteroidales bacterium]|nr:leucine-rich repeat domain-containing protein [Bacteroidales bacterium]
MTVIKQYAFYGATCLTSVTIGNSVTYIGSSAFSGCTGLESIIVGSGNTVYDSRNNCNAIIETSTNTLISGCKNTIIPNSVTYIGPGAFYGCSGLTSVTFPNSVIAIGYYAFSDCSGLTSLTIPNSVTYIGEWAFSNCSGLTTVNFNATNCTTMGIWDYPVFYGCTALATLNIGDNVTKIPDYAFYGCSGLTGTLTIPNSVTSIGSSAFSGCSGLTSLTIPNSVTSISNYAFYNCSGFNEIHSLNSVPPTAYSNTFGGVPTNTPVYIPCGRLSYYTAADGWSTFTNFIESSAATFSAVSNDNTMGSVQILTMPTCTNPQAVVYAVANSGYQFDHWSDNSTSNPYSLTVNEDMELTAYFSPIGSQPTTYYTITVSANDAEMGTVTGGGSFAEGTTTTITATANSGYHFVQWQDGNTEASRSITVTADAEYTAYFAANGINYYTITVTSDDAEMGTVTGGGSFAEGTTTTITATANSGYHFVQWQDGNTEASRSITVTADAEYTAYFAANGANDYTITVIAQNPSMGSTTGSGTFAYGTATTITAEPYEGYYFVQWNDGNTQRIRTITVTGNATYTAYFDRSNGIDDITSDNIMIYSRGNEIIIEGAENSDALIYDVMGRIVHKGRIEGPIHVNAMGVYMVKIANHPSHKVVVK